MDKPRWLKRLANWGPVRRLVGPARSLQTRFTLSYGAIVIALTIFLNTYPVLISQSLMFQSKEDSLRRQTDIVTSTLAGSEALTADGVEANLTKLGITGVDRIMVTDPPGGSSTTPASWTTPRDGTPFYGKWSPPSTATTSSARNTGRAPSAAAPPLRWSTGA